MPSTDLDLANPGGRLALIEGALFSVSDVHAMGDAALRTVMQLLRALYYDETDEVPQSGVFGRADDGSAGHLNVTSSGGLAYAVEEGWGLVFDSGATPSTWEIEEYRPVVLATEATGNLAAHEAQPRIDLIVAEPAWEEDNSQTRNVRNPSDQTITTPSVNTRRKLSATVTVVKGTAAASPVAPSVPAGSILLAECAVPANSGNITVTDRRLFLRQTTGVPKRGPYVVRGAAPTKAGNDIEIDPGVVEVAGVQYWFAGDTITPDVDEGAGNTVSFVVTIDSSGSANVTRDIGGTGDPPVVPTVPADEALVCWGYGNSATLTEIEDWRGGPVGPGELSAQAVEAVNIAEDAVEHSKIADDTFTRTIAGVAFVPDNTTDPWTYTDGHARSTYSGGGTSYTWLADLGAALPDGATILSVEVYYHSTGNASSVGVSLERCSLTSTTPVVIDSDTDTPPTGPDEGSIALTGLSTVVDYGNNLYFVQFDHSASTAGNIWILGCQVTYTAPTP